LIHEELGSGSISLAPKKKPTKLQREMAQSVEELTAKFETMSKQFTGFQSMMQNMLDSLNGMGSSQVSANKAFGDLCDRAEGTKTSLDVVSTRIDFAASRVDSLEAWLTTAPAPAAAPIAQPAPALRNVDLNTAPRSSSCSPVMDGERAMGHDKHCGGLLGTRPQVGLGGTLSI
jgi:chaperonin cofactor prefoldin